MRSQIKYIATTCTAHFFLGCEIGQLVNLKTGGNVVSGGGGGGGGSGILLVWMCESVFGNQPQSYTWPFKKKNTQKNSLFIYLITQKVDQYSYTVL